MSSGHRQVLDHINSLIASGDMHTFFAALKGFRNGVVYGTRVRAPHALVLNLVWSHAPYRTMPAKIFKVTRTHALSLGFSSVIYTVTLELLKALQGGAQKWHTAVGGFLIGFIVWNDPNNHVHIQMMMYMLSRVISALYHLVATRRFNGAEAPKYAFRVWMGLLYAITMLLLTNAPDTLQGSMAQSLDYIFIANHKFTKLFDVVCVNSDKSF